MRFAGFNPGQSSAYTCGFSQTNSESEGAHNGTITHAATSADANYSGLAISSVTASIADNDSSLVGGTIIGVPTFSPTPDISTLAGSGAAGDADETGAAARFDNLDYLTTDGSSVFVADSVNGSIRRIVIATAGVTKIQTGFLNLRGMPLRAKTVCEARSPGAGESPVGCSRAGRAGAPRQNSGGAEDSGTTGFNLSSA